MASPSECSKGRLWVVIIILLFSITSLPPKPAAVQGLVARSSSAASEIMLEQRKLAMGSRPPQCENKCFGCRPCIAKLVIIISPHHEHDHHLHKKKSSTSTVKDASSSSFSVLFDNYKDEGVDNYYLVTWKCTCGNKFYHP